MRNRGDAFKLALTIKVDNVDITEGQFDDIEFTINKESYSNCIQKTLTDGTIEWDSVRNKYVTELTQKDTFAMQNKNTWQIRLFKIVRGVSTVVSNDNTGTIELGDVNSKEVLG